MGNDTRYNGWANRETWLMNLHGFTNNKEELAKQMYMEAKATGYATKEQVAKYRLADALKDEFEEYALHLDGVNGIIADLLTGAIDRIDWDKLADHILSGMDLDEEEEEEEEE